MSTTNLGHVTAYAYAKSKGYTGTEAEFAEAMANFSGSAEIAVNAANAASGYESAASAAAGDAMSYRDAAAGSASTASTAATNAEGYKNTANAAAVAATDAAQSVLMYKGSPLTASTVAGMTDTTHVYVYTGTETGYVAGNWYYYDNGSWVSGGVYNSVAVQTDDTLTVQDAPADAKAVGEVRDSSDKNLTSMYERVVSAQWSDGGISSSGGNSSSYNGIRIRSDYYYIKNGMQITIPAGMMGRVAVYTPEGGAAGFIKWLDTGYWTGTKIFNNPPGDLFRMVVRYEPEASILPSAGDLITIKTYSFTEPILTITQNSDLNDYLTPGTYYSPNTATTATLLNCPLKDTAFKMDVTEARDTGSGRVRQTIYKADYREQDGFFMRYLYSSSTYGPWDHYLPSKAQHTPQIFYPNEKEYSARTIDNVVARFRVGTYNVAHYRMNQTVYNYISGHSDAIEKWRRWVANSNMDFLFLTEDSQYIDSAQTMLATKYLYNPYFYENNIIKHSHRILTKTEFDTTSLETVIVPNVNPSGLNTAYYIDWCISTVANIGSILLAVIHNFPSGPTAIGTEAQVKQNRVNYYAAIKNLLAEESGNYDYVIIAGDTNAGNYVNETMENTEYDMGLLESLCEDTDTHLVNGGEIGWFKTVPSSQTVSRAFDNIIVSNNIRVEKIECNPFMYEELWSDHVPVIAEVSLLG